MTNHRHNSLHRFFSSRVFLLGALIVAITFALGFARAYYQDWQVKQEISRLQSEVSSLQKKKIESLDILTYVESDAYVEDRARTELNMKKPGERVLFLNTANTEEQDISTIKETGQVLSNPVKWWYYFTQHTLPRESD